MDNEKTFLNELTSHYEAFKEKDASIESLVNEIEYYESFIPEFFSKNGEAEGIRNMYSGVRTMMESNQEKTINCVEITKSSDIYFEYMDGMIQFINDIKNLNTVNDENSLASFTEKFNSAKDKDALFIESLYNGKLNEPSDMVLSEAVTNIEFLIDFIPNLKTMKSNCLTVQEAVKEVDDMTKQSLLNNCANMLCESVNNFCYSTIKAVVDTYNGINDVLTEKVTEQIDDTFVLL